MLEESVNVMDMTTVVADAPVYPLALIQKSDILADRSRIVQDWKCPRSRYLQYEYDRIGIVADGMAIELFLGTVIHDALARIADRTAAGPAGSTFMIGDIANEAREQVVGTLRAAAPAPEGEGRQFAAEQGALTEGLIRGFGRQVWPRLMAAYPIIRHVEQEMFARIPAPGGKTVVLMSRPDLVLAADPADAGWYFEYKSTSSKRREWVDSWATAVQVHSGVAAVAETTGIQPHGTIIQGLYKGFESYGRQQSPFCYGYIKPASPPFVKREMVSYDYKAGFTRIQTWDRPGGVQAWVDGMDEVMLGEQFPQTPPIFLKEDLLAAFLAQTGRREAEIADAVEMIEGTTTEGGRGATLDRYFPQKFDQCQPAFGRGCQFKQVCHGRVEDPLTQGFVYREPHHTAEVDRWKEDGRLPSVDAIVGELNHA